MFTLRALIRMIPGTILTVSFIMLCRPCAAQDSPLNKKFSPAQLKADLQVFSDSLLLLHPAIYRYHSKDVIRHAFDVAKRKMDSPLTATEFYNLTAPLIGLAGDVHSSIELPASIHQAAAGQALLFPFDVRIIGDEIIVASNNSADSTINPGTRILSVNGQSASQVIRRLSVMFSSDGTNTTFKKRMAEQRFAFQLPYAYGFPTSFKISFSTPSNQVLLRTLPATDFLTIQKRRKENSDRYPAILPAYPQQPFFSLLFLPDRKATLTLRTFEDQDGIQAGNFREFVDSAFDEIVNTGVRDLIIDIRMNNGGPSANAAYLYSWLTEQSFPFVHSLELTPAGLARLQTNRLQFVKNRITGNFTTMDTATTTVPALFGLGPQTPQKTPYLGKLIVLVDGLTASGGPQFASLVVRNKRGLVRGEETSGALAGGSGRMYTAFALPNTQLEVVISMVRIHFTPPSSSKPDENVKPDVELKRDYRAGFKLE